MARETLPTQKGVPNRGLAASLSVPVCADTHLVHTLGREYHLQYSLPVIDYRPTRTLDNENQG